MLPDRLTASPSSTVWSGPAFADSGLGGTPEAADTVTSTVSVSVSIASEPTPTVSVNVSVTSLVRPVGAVKPAVAVFAPVSVTVGLPPVWLHE